MPLPNRLLLLTRSSSTRPSTRLLSSPPTPLLLLHQRRTLQTTSALNALKESRDKEGIESDIEHHKQDQLKKQEEGKGHWKEELASESESAVKADRGEVKKTSPEDIKKLQDETAGKV